MSSTGSKITQRRIATFLQQLQSDMATLEERAISRPFLESEEWFDLVLKAFESAARTRELEKMRLYSRILRNSLIPAKREKANPEAYLSVLVELTTIEIELAKAIYEQQKDTPNEGENELQWARRKGWENLISQGGVHTSDVYFLLKRIERTGLIREITGMYVGYVGGVYVVTEAFRNLMMYLLEKAT